MAVFLGACPAPVEEEVVDREIVPGVYRVEGIATDLPHDDLAPVGDVVGDAHFVALGETVHTSGGYYQAKARLFRYLVEEKGFRAYGWESPWDDALVASEYVRTCDGTSREALQSLFGVWWDPSVQDTLEWMCAWNQDHPDDPLYFFGWDIQQGADDGIRLQAFLEEGAPESASALYAGIATCAGVGHPSMDAFYGSADYLAYENGQVSAADNQACHHGLAAIDATIDANEAALEAATSADEVFLARMSVISLGAYEDEMYLDPTSYVASFEARDEANAEVLLAWRDHFVPGEKVVIWAHNAHIGREWQSVHGWGQSRQVFEWQGTRNTGYWLDQAVGDDYVPIGLAALEVHISWGDFQDPQVPAHADAVEVQLDALGEEYLFVDLDPAAEEPFFAPDTEYQLAMEWSVTVDQFAGLFFLSESEAMTWVW
jgi:erythromycin esterase